MHGFKEKNHGNVINSLYFCIKINIAKYYTIYKDLKEAKNLESKDNYAQSDYFDLHNAKFDEISISVSYLFVKRFLDMILSFMGIILLSPLLAVITVIVKLTSKGPVIYKQKRLGKSGKSFTIYKFRSMYDGAENLKNFLNSEAIKFYKKNRKIPNDPRVTKIGSFLRLSSLDELPQLFNILKGDMSIVGPRPLLLDEIRIYGDLYNNYVNLRPGLTGLWQVSGRSETTFEERVMFDKKYIDSLSLFNDIKIIFRTVGAVISGKGAC